MSDYNTDRYTSDEYKRDLGEINKKVTEIVEKREGRYVRKLEQAGWTREAIARFLGCAPETLSRKYPRGDK